MMFAHNIPLYSMHYAVSGNLVVVRLMYPPPPPPLPSGRHRLWSVRSGGLFKNNKALNGHTTLHCGFEWTKKVSVCMYTCTWSMCYICGIAT